MDDRIERLEALGVDIGPTLKRFYEDVDLLTDMLREFADENLLAELESIEEPYDAAMIERVAHAAKGTSANLGLVDLSARCDDVVQAARGGRLECVEQHVADALAAFRDASAGIREL